MYDINIKLNPENYNVLSNYSLYGFRSKDEVVNSALDLFRMNCEPSQIELSAKLYLDEYESSKDLRDLTESALYDLTE